MHSSSSSSDMSTSGKASSNEGSCSSSRTWKTWVKHVLVLYPTLAQQQWQTQTWARVQETAAAACATRVMPTQV
jgi:hypothetical protein